jgi:hypothetical protein
MADQKSESIIPWPAVVALVAMIGGAYWYLDPLTSSRPRVDPRQSSQSLNAQDVDSRLWQDPVATTGVLKEQLLLEKPRDERLEHTCCR